MRANSMRAPAMQRNFSSSWGPWLLDVARTVAEPGRIKYSFFVAQRLPAHLVHARRKTHRRARQM
jgi:hypothetical protein